MRFQTENGVLIAQANGETLRIEPWGKDSLPKALQFYR